MDKRAQFTMYVVLGMVLAAIFAFAFYMREQYVKDDMDKKANQIFAEFWSNNVKNHVESCLKQVSERGLEDIGKQGGILLQEQGGSYVLDQTNLGKDFLLIQRLGLPVYVFYGIKEKPLRDPPGYPRAPPYYPHDTQLFSEYEGIYFGRNTLIKLCDKDGPNRIDVSNQTMHSCLAGTYNVLDNEPTIQGMLAEYVENNINECVDLESYIEQSGHNISLTGDVSAGVIFGANGLTFNLTFPLSIKIKNAEPVQRSKSFTFYSRVRLKEIYNLAYAIINQDIADIEFNVTSEYNSLYHWKPGMRVDVINNPCQNTACFTAEQGMYDNVIVIQDSNSILNDDAYLFEFAVENRRPDLEKMEGYYEFNSGDTLQISINALDPDDDSLDIYFVGLSGVTVIHHTLRKVLDDGDVDWHNNNNISVKDEEGLDDWQSIIINVNSAS